jgi:8-oxo-dGTP diphosphatase
MWDGDTVFLDLLEKRTDFFSLKLCYDGETLTDVYIDNVKQ